MSDLINTYPIKHIIEHKDGLKSFYFDKPFDAKPGQFINLWIPEVDEKPFSISDLTNDLMEISVKAIGPFTHELMKKMPGEYLGVRGPFGNGFSLNDNCIVIGGGIGIAPLRFLVKALDKSKKRFVTLLGALNQKEIIFKDEFEKITPCYFTTDDGSFGKRGLVTDDLENIIKKEKIEYIYAAGPEQMYLPIIKIAGRLNIPFQITFERYMKCGIGICGQCVMDGSGVRLCVEGPVLTQKEVQDITEIGLPHRDACGRRSAL